MNAKTLSEKALADLVADLVAAGTPVTAPARGADGKVDYRPITRLDAAALDAELPRRSLKEFFVPPTEPLFSWTRGRSGVTIDPVATSFPPHLVLGARPCDAAAVEILDRVMGWDYRDELWFGRREATTIAALACRGVDGACFCTATGQGPESRRGADLFMTPTDGGFLTEAVTPKGEAFMDAHVACFVEAEDGHAARRSPALRSAEASVTGLSMPTVGEWLAHNFEHPLWEEVALRCHGCGACAAVCPTCHCFDIVDEPEGVRAGTRRRNWDTCQAARFTVHASGHNPRRDQGARFRQRVMHKFYIYPARFGEVLCTGCGRCARACPAGMNLPEILRAIGGLNAARLVAAGGEA